MIVSCPHCQKKLEVPSSSAGGQVACPQCNNAFTVPAAAGAAAAVAPRRRAAAGTASPVVVLAKVSMMIGLLLVVAGRSCEKLGVRSIGRVQAKLSQAEDENRESNDGRLDEDDSKVKGLRKDVKEAITSQRMNGLWYEVLFMIGTILLLLGLVGVGFGGTGAERTVAMVMIAVLTFSLFVYGKAWYAP